MSPNHTNNQPKPPLPKHTLTTKKKKISLLSKNNFLMLPTFIIRLLTSSHTIYLINRLLKHSLYQEKWASAKIPTRKYPKEEIKPLWENNKIDTKLCNTSVIEKRKRIASRFILLLENSKENSNSFILK